MPTLSNVRTGRNGREAPVSAGARHKDSIAADSDEATLLAEIANLEDCDRAEAMLMGIRPRCSSRVWLVAERKYGQLLQLAGVGKDEPWSKRNARKVADVDQETFDRYLATTKSPTRKGLLRCAIPPEELQQQQAKRDGQLEWLNSKDGHHWIEKNLWEFGGIHPPAQAKQNTPKGPITDPQVKKAFDIAVAEIRGRRSARAKMSGSKRLRELNSGKVTELTRLQLEIAQLCVVLEDFDVEDYDLSDQPVEWRATAIYEDLLLLGEWLDRSLTSIQRHLSDTQVRDKIVKLRDTTGRTAEEAETALRLAAVIERKLENRLG